MPSINALWIPTLVTAHVLSIALFLYALERIGGLITYYFWAFKWHLFLKRKFKGDKKMAWYWTYPGAKEAYDTQTAAAAMTEVRMLILPKCWAWTTPPPPPSSSQEQPLINPGSWSKQCFAYAAVKCS